jgi:hypothetical protein
MNKKLLVDCITFDVDKSVLKEAMSKKWTIGCTRCSTKSRS